MDTPTKKPGFGAALIYAAVAAAAILFVVRLTHGVDFTDEAVYIATARRFALGGRPFIDDIDAHQLAGWLMSPIVWTYLQAKGSTDGIVLFMRAMYAAVFVATAWAVPRRELGLKPPYAAIAAAAALLAAPFLIYALSYNTVGALLAALSIHLSVRAAGGEGTKRLLCCIGAAAAMVLGCVAYVAFIPLALASPILLWWQSKRDLRLVGLYLVASMVMVAGVVVLLAPNLSAVGQTIAYNLTLANYYNWAGGAAKFEMLLHGAFSYAGATPSFWLASVIAVLRVSRHRVPGWLVICCVALMPVTQGPLTLWGLYFAVTALLVATATHIGRGRPTSCWSPLVAALLASVGTAYASGNGFMAAGIGAWGFLPVTAAMAIQSSANAVSEYDLARFARVGAAVTLSLLMLGAAANAALRAAYNDVGLLAATHRVDDGPWAGLSTDWLGYGFAAELNRLVPLLSGDRRVFGFDGFPSAYLVGDARPASPQLWVSPADEKVPGLAAPILDEVMRYRDAGVLVLKNNAGDYGPGSIIWTEISTECEVVAETPFFRVLELRRSEN